MKYKVYRDSICGRRICSELFLGLELTNYFFAKTIALGLGANFSAAIGVRIHETDDI
jgi:hypothetical protein